jgi:hypothetical protein
MKKLSITVIIIAILLSSCGEKSKKSRGLDNTLFKYASLIRWANFDAALRYLKPGDKEIIPTRFELERLKQFKVGRYIESPITPGNKPTLISQSVEIQLYNIHTNVTKTIYDHQIWEYDEKRMQWFIISGLPKL